MTPVRGNGRRIVAGLGWSWSSCCNRDQDQFLSVHPCTPITPGLFCAPHPSPVIAPECLLLVLLAPLFHVTNGSESSGIHSILILGLILSAGVKVKHDVVSVWVKLKNLEETAAAENKQPSGRVHVGMVAMRRKKCSQGGWGLLST